MTVLAFDFDLIMDVEARVSPGEELLYPLLTNSFSLSSSFRTLCRKSLSSFSGRGERVAVIRAAEPLTEPAGLAQDLLQWGFIDKLRSADLSVDLLRGASDIDDQLEPVHSMSPLRAQ